MSRRVPRPPPDEADLAEKLATLQAQQAPQVWILCDEAETRAMATTRVPALADLRRQARARLRWFLEG